VNQTRILISALLLLFFTITAYGQSNSRDKLYDSHECIDSLILSQMQKHAITGVSLAIISNSVISYSKGYGLRDIDTDKNIDQNTVFESASLSKPVFAYTVLKLASRGIIDLDQPLYDYYTDVDIENDSLSRLVTARILLTHTAGFPNWRGKGKLKMNTIPGAKFRYSGEGFVYLQKAIERITRKPVEDIINDEVLHPLQMDNSSYVWKSEFDQNFACGHKKKSKYKNKWKPSRVNAAASLHTTACDYARFLVAVNGAEGLSQKVSDEFLLPQIETSKENVFWGLGFGLEKVGVKYNVWHWGHNPGFRAFFIMLPETSSGFVLFTNSDKGLKMVKEVIVCLTGSDLHPCLSWF
jgi:CubicO group peptidase (beta-lactamase class C family)